MYLINLDVSVIKDPGEVTCGREFRQAGAGDWMRIMAGQRLVWREIQPDIGQGRRQAQINENVANLEGAYSKSVAGIEGPAEVQVRHRLAMLKPLPRVYHPDRRER